MRVRLHLKPGQRGTKKLLAQYGDRLVCVRYRYDAEKKKRFKTVELIVDEIEWEPRRRVPPYDDDTLVGVRVGRLERDLRRRLGKAGAKWKGRPGVWELRYGEVVALGLEGRMVEPQASGAAYADVDARGRSI